MSLLIYLAVRWALRRNSARPVPAAAARSGWERLPQTEPLWLVGTDGAFVEDFYFEAAFD